MEIKSPYKDLAYAIVLRAVDDYRAIRRFYSRYTLTDKSPKWVKDRFALFKTEYPQLIKFFNSYWCEALTGIEGDVIYRKLNEEQDER